MPVPSSLRGIVLNRFNEIRSGWRIVLFLTLLLILGVALEWVMRRLSLANPLLESVVLCAAALAVAWFMTSVVNHKPVGATGLWFHPRMLQELTMGALIGFLMMAGIFVTELVFGYVRLEWRAVALSESVVIVVVSLLGFGFAAAFEEMLFRGYMFQTLTQGITVLPATLVISGVFAAAHAANPSASTLSSINVFLAGVWLSLAYIKTRSLWLPFGLHWSWNFSQTTVFGYPTSGIGFADRRLFDQIVQGPDWITGGGFGPEGGVLATIVLVLGAWYILKSRVLKVPEGIITLDSLEDILPERAENRTE